MKKMKALFCIFLYLHCCSIIGQVQEIPFKNLKAFNGNTHAHSILSYSHGGHLKRSSGFVKGDKVLFTDSLFLSRPKNKELKENWDLFQGLPEKHYEEAIKANYDFYCVTDHSQEEAFFPNATNNSSWAIAKKQAEIASKNNFSAFMGVEHSENDSNNGRGHYNVIGSSSYINAIRPGIDIPYFYNWLKENPKNLTTGNPVVVTFNHPNKDQFNNWAYRDDEITELITLLEIINNKKPKYDGFINALDKGWKVSPVAGIDNHNYTEIPEAQSRTFVLAENNSPRDILTAMRKRRTYASFDKNLECRYSVNDSVMGSTIKQSNLYNLKIYINDPDINDNSDKISQIDLVTHHGKVIKSIKSENLKHKNYWNISVKNKEIDSYLFIQVWDNPNPSNNNVSPVSWLAPVWILD
ncbi:hypothetical protein FPF71_08895 [Algibacter amylolyticus]|uniref:DUF3604 domain-containing protein n=1 Tax=Algibacter amylolyticus TaxID=1608400 RepID=A0A5M7B8Y0_9FLAO|nr:hypothetical protein [Algibacter amylolyticus]KAA5824788.1 hypothetical protein F2B50_08895 [Algibacter amylolyticus]MBB5268905.1 hypothetical protein [Algibacter amylolyticus]TSJ75953.1 hypothetical protein FPF71_08895 [Algibacter amylolyticus]